MCACSILVLNSIIHPYNTAWGQCLFLDSCESPSPHPTPFLHPLLPTRIFNVENDTGHFPIGMGFSLAIEGEMSYLDIKWSINPFLSPQWTACGRAPGHLAYLAWTIQHSTSKSSVRTLSFR